MTDVQYATFMAIQRHIEEHGWPPTRAELGKLFKVNPNAIQCRLKSLERIGAIEISPGLARGIKVTDYGA